MKKHEFTRTVRPIVSRICHTEMLEARRLLSAVSSITLFNADSDSSISTLSSDTVIDLAKTPNVNLVANVDSSTASVKFGYDGNSSYRTENSKPLAIAGDDDGDLRAWNPSVGTHTVTVTPYSGANAGGTKGSAKSVTFKVIDSGGSSSPTKPVAAPLPTSNSSGNNAPSVSLGNTTLGTFAGPGYFLLQAKASDSDGSISRVEFYANGKFIGKADAAPHMMSWRNVQPGSYDITAKAIDNEGGSKTSSAGTIKVVNPDGDTFYVSTDGSDSKSGSSSSPFRTIKRALSAANAGDTIRIQPGTYKETLKLRDESATAAKPITIEAVEKGTVTIDGGGAKDYIVCPAWSGAGQYTHFDGITFRNVNNTPGQDTAAVKTADGWHLTDCKIEDVAGAAVALFGNDIVLLRVTAQDNGCTGIGGAGPDNSMVLDSVSRGNNTKEYSGSFEGGGGKFTRVNGLLVENYHSYNNKGPGIWFDGDNINITIRDSVFNDNVDLWRSDGSQKIGGRGIQLEISGVDADGSRIGSQGPILIENVLTYDNDNASVQVYATANVTIRKSTFVNDYIDLKDKRPDPYLLRDLTIVDNAFDHAFIAADTATVSDWKNEDFKIDRNVYDNGGSKIMSWNGKTYTSTSSLASALGFEKNGDLGSVSYSKL